MEYFLHDYVNILGLININTKPKPYSTSKHFKNLSQSHKKSIIRAKTKTKKEKENIYSNKKQSYLPYIKNIKSKIETQKNRGKESGVIEMQDYNESKLNKSEESVQVKKNQFVEVFVRIRPFMKFEFRDKHKSK